MTCSHHHNAYKGATVNATHFCTNFLAQFLDSTLRSISITATEGQLSFHEHTLKSFSPKHNKPRIFRVSNRTKKNHASRRQAQPTKRLQKHYSGGLHFGVQIFGSQNECDLAFVLGSEIWAPKPTSFFLVFSRSVHADVSKHLRATFFDSGLLGQIDPGTRNANWRGLSQPDCFSFRFSNII